MTDRALGFYGITLLANNVAELGAFYAKLGLRQVIDREQIKVFSLGKQDLVIHSAAERPNASVGISILVQQLGPIEQQLREANIAYEGPKPLEAGFHGLELRDPNNNPIHFLEARTP